MKLSTQFRIIFYCIIVLILFSPLRLWAGNPVILEPDRGEYSLAPHLEILEDRENKWTIEDATSAALYDKFIPNNKESNPSFGFTNSAYWVRFTVKNNTKEKEHLLEIALPLLDRIDLYIPEDKGGHAIKKTGRLLPFKERDIKHRNFVFNLPAHTGDEQTYYLRFKTESVMSFPMTLWSKGSFYEKDDDEYIALGIYYGIIFVMVLYNLFLFFSLRDKNYLFYILYIASHGLFQVVMNGIAYEYLWPNSIWWNQRANMFFAGVAGFWAAKFTRSFLTTEKYTPKLDKALLILMIWSSLAAVLSLIVSYSIIVKIVTLLAASLVLIILPSGILCWQKGYHPSKYFTIAWSSFLGGIFLVVLTDIKVLPLNFITWYSMQIGSAFEVVLLSLALADRINILKKEKENLYNTLLSKEEYFRSLIENSSDIVTIMDDKGTFLYTSPSVERILGYKTDDLIGKNTFDYIHPADIPRIFDVFTQLVQTPGIFPKEEFRFRHKDGSWHFIESIGYNLLNNPAVKGIIVNTRDITENKILQEDAMRSGHLASIGELAAGVAHEINNPIMGIINYAQIVANKSEKGIRENDGDMILDIANRIKKEGDRIANIVKNLLSFARESREEKSYIHVSKILSDTLSLTETQIRKDGIKLKTNLPQILPKIVANPQQIEQVFLNIISNARYALNTKFAKGDENKILEIQGEETIIDNSQYVKIIFYDTGAGISPNIMEKIFNPFFTTKPRGEGTGLGLSISHGIIRSHGGRLLLDSMEGEFTRVEVILPCR